MSAVGATTCTTCPYCGVGCGVLATPQVDGAVAIAGDPDHPANFGRLCSKGAALGETLALDDRLLAPRIGGRDAGWDEALNLVAARFTETIATHGPESVAFYVSGQLLTEDYYVANKLMKGFIGSANIDSNSRLCMASAVAGHRRAFGADVVPGTYADLEEAELVVLVGSNLAWCHPVLYQRLAAARAAHGTKVVVVDPRQTASCDIADLHLPLRSGTDVALFAGLAAHLVRHGLARADYILAHTKGLPPEMDAEHGPSIVETSRRTGVSIELLRQFFDVFGRTEKVVSVFSQGVNQSANGTDKANAIINCHLITGRIGRPGMGPFSVTGQPNAMGGREVGALSNLLAAHLNLDSEEDRARLRRFWGSPRMAMKPGLKAVDLFRAVKAGRIKALWIMATNPVVSLPEADEVAAALAACPFVVVSDVAQATDTLAYSHVALPAAAWGEKDGTVTNSERRISRQRPFLPLPGAARPDWWIISEVARRMGFREAFAYRGPDAIFAEHAALSAFENNGMRAFDIGAKAGLDAAGYDALRPFQWPARVGQEAEQTRFFADGGFYADDRRARIVPLAEPPADAADGMLVLNTGRIRDQWHTMTRTGKTARLMAHFSEPFCEIHPIDAEKRGVSAASLVAIENEHGLAILRALVTDRVRQGEIFAPMHWTNQFANAARVGTAITAVVDPISGQPALKSSPVRLRAVSPAWHGFFVGRKTPVFQNVAYSAIARAEHGFRAELAGEAAVDDWAAWLGTAIGVEQTEGLETVAYHDTLARVHRVAMFAGAQLVATLFVSPQPVEVARRHVADCLGKRFETAAERLRVLAGRPGAAESDAGAVICACRGVGVNTIIHALSAGAETVDAVGKATSAGTQCGSCRAEIRRLIDERRFEKAG